MSAAAKGLRKSLKGADADAARQAGNATGADDAAAVAKNQNQLQGVGDNVPTSPTPEVVPSKNRSEEQKAAETKMIEELVKTPPNLAPNIFGRAWKGVFGTSDPNDKGELMSALFETTDITRVTKGSDLETDVNDLRNVFRDATGKSIPEGAALKEDPVIVKSKVKGAPDIIGSESSNGTEIGEPLYPKHLQYNDAETPLTAEKKKARYEYRKELYNALKENANERTYMQIKANNRTYSLGYDTSTEKKNLGQTGIWAFKDDNKIRYEEGSGPKELNADLDDRYDLDDLVASGDDEMVILKTNKDGIDVPGTKDDLVNGPPYARIFRLTKDTETEEGRLTTYREILTSRQKKDKETGDYTTTTSQAGGAGGAADGAGRQTGGAGGAPGGGRQASSGADSAADGASDAARRAAADYKADQAEELTIFSARRGINFISRNIWLITSVLAAMLGAIGLGWLYAKSNEIDTSDTEDIVLDADGNVVQPEEEEAGFMDEEMLMYVVGAILLVAAVFLLPKLFGDEQPPQPPQGAGLGPGGEGGNGGPPFP